MSVLTSLFEITATDFDCKDSVFIHYNKYLFTILKKIIMSTAIERFVRFHKHLQLTEMYPGRNALEDKLEVSKGYITKAMTKKSAMGSDLLERIMRLFPQLNIVWLLTGEGDMILEEDDSKYQVKDYRDTIINKMKDDLRDAYAEIGELRMKLKSYEENGAAQKVG